MSKETYDPMDLKSLRCFEVMAKHGSLTRASIELGISGAAVSDGGSLGFIVPPSRHSTRGSVPITAIRDRHDDRSVNTTKCQ